MLNPIMVRVDVLSVLRNQECYWQQDEAGWRLWDRWTRGVLAVDAWARRVWS